MALYLKVASPLWVPGAEFGQPGGPGDAFRVALLLWPLLLLFAVLDLVALACIIRRGFGGRNAAALVIWSTIVAMWLATYLLDRLAAFNIVDRAYV